MVSGPSWTNPKVALSTATHILIQVCRAEQFLGMKPFKRVHFVCYCLAEGLLSRTAFKERKDKSGAVTVGYE